MTLTGFQRGLRRVVKRFIYSQLYLREALFIVFGWAKPLISFKVESSPPSIYFNFALKPERAAELQRELDLPHPLEPIQCLEGEAPFHCLTLNIYRVSGLVNGIRAEWSVYVREPSTGKPRYLIVEACSDSGSMDPVAIVTRAGQVSHELKSEGLSSEATSENGSAFKSLCRKPTNGHSVRAAPQWIEANDYIYWRNGICDRTFYDSGLANARAIQLDVSEVEIEDATSWAAMVESVPRHVIVFQDEIEFAISPWWNIDEA